MWSTWALMGVLAVSVPAVSPSGPPVVAAAWGWPLAPPHEVVQGFAPPAHDWLPGDRGVDLAAKAGEAVVAAGAGRVSFAGAVGGTGVVAIRHTGGLVTTYEPVRPQVHLGQTVALGARIGRVVSGWARCRPRVCLHWGLKRGDSYLDPLGLVGAAQIRLLPVDRAPAPAWWSPVSAAGAVVVVPMVYLARRRRGLSRGSR